MAHYAFIDTNNIVVEVIVGRDETETVNGISDWEKHYEEFRDGLICKRTSKNTVGNTHSEGRTPFRYNYAELDGSWDATKGTDGAFIPRKPFDSWILNEDTCQWSAPIEKPTDFKGYYWSEVNREWVRDSFLD